MKKRVVIDTNFICPLCSWNKAKLSVDTVGRYYCFCPQCSAIILRACDWGWYKYFRDHNIRIAEIQIKGGSPLGAGEEEPVGERIIKRRLKK